MLRRLAPALLLFAGCADNPDFQPPSARFSPEVLEFGVVSVDGQRTLSIEVTNTGQVGYKILDAAVPNDSRGLFSVLLEPALRDGIAPGARAMLEVTYRACPEAWDGEALKAGFDLDQCPVSPVAEDLVITDEAREVRLLLSGAPGLQPQAELYCPRATDDDGCPTGLDDSLPCTSVRWGRVGYGQGCEAEVEIVNRRRQGARTADLLITQADLRVREIGGAEVLVGAAGGFSLLDAAGAPLSPSAAAPLVVPVTEGQDEGRVRVRVRFDPQADVVLAGIVGDGEGLAFTTNDPSTPRLGASVFATGSLPEITLTPNHQPLPVDPEVGETRTQDFLLRNAGGGNAEIESVTLVPAHPEMTLSPSVDGLPLADGDSRRITLTYARTSAELARVTIIAKMVAPVRSPLPVRINTDFSQDQCEVSPELVDFGATAGGELTATLKVRAVGTGGCTVNEIDIGGPSPASATEFAVELPGCSSLPCNPGIVLCPQSDPTCTDWEMDIPLRYRNSDLSTTDLAELTLRTTDAVLPDKLVVLQAADDPCFPPIPTITVLTPEPCVEDVVDLTAADSTPGGRASMPATIVDWEWAFAFSSGGEELVPPNTETTMFQPQSAGFVQVSLSVTNSCGARSLTPAQEQILIQGTCP